MTWVLVKKLLRDLRLAWLVVAVLLFLFQILWSRITERITAQILQQFQQLGFSANKLMDIVFAKDQLPGQLVQAVIGGENIQPDRAQDIMSISYVHPLAITILCIWAIGRAANAIAGEIDRGTMELLLAQPIRRTQVILAHVLVDVITFPLLCLVIWTGTFCGTWWLGLQTAEGRQHVEPLHFLPALACILGLLFSVSGMTLWLSSMGRSRPRVWGLAISLFLAMFLINVLGQIWTEPLSWVRPLTIFYHYQPQTIIQNPAIVEEKVDQKHVEEKLKKDVEEKLKPVNPKKPWYSESEPWQHLFVLAGIGLSGYFLAWTTFCRRDLPAPL